MNAAGAVAPWRFAARLARREVMRRPWRTVLVALLVALPIAGMTVASVLTRADNQLTWLEHEYGEGTDLAISRPADQALDIDTLIPAGSSTRQLRMAWVSLERSDGTVAHSTQLSDSFDVGADSPMRTVTGREPRDGEVWVSSTLADELGVDVGDRLDLDHPRGSWIVAGVGAPDFAVERRLMVMPDLPLSQFRDWVFPVTTLVDLPDTLTGDEVEQIAVSVQDGLTRVFGGVADEGGGPYASWDSGRGRDEFAPLAWTWVVGTIALAATGIIVAAAFATSARRQLATIGILSANGSSERLTRRALAAQGAWTGAVGSIVGVTAGVAVLILGRSTIERVNGHRLEHYDVNPVYLALIALTGVVAATVSALIPARTASKVPVMAALAGRRPLGKVPARLVPRGIGFAALGSLLLVVGALSRNGGAAPTFAAMVGGVFVLIGMCCCSPLAVDLIGRACAPLTGTWRLACRGLSRTRTRSAAIVTAIAVIGALTMSGAATAIATRDDTPTRQLPADVALIIPERAEPPSISGIIDLEPEVDEPVPAAMRADIDAIVPDADWSPRRVATFDPEPFPQVGDPYPEAVWWQFLVADEAVMDLYGLSAADRDALDRAGVMVVSPWLRESLPTLRDGSVISIPHTGGAVDLDVVLSGDVRRAAEDGEPAYFGAFGAGDFLITEEAAAAAGLEIVERGGVVRSDEPLTRAQRDGLQDAIYGNSIVLGDYYVDTPQIEMRAGPHWSYVVNWPDDPTSNTAIQGLLVGIAFVLTLLVVAIGLALAAAEGVAERDVLVAVGGRPKTMRSMAAVKAVVLTVTGLGLAVPFGLLPTYAVLRATDHAFHVPWLVLGALVVAVPVLAGAITWVVSALGQAIRPVRISALAFD